MNMEQEPPTAKTKEKKNNDSELTPELEEHVNVRTVLQ